MLLRELPSVVVTMVTMIQQISQRRLYSPQFSGTVTRWACAFVNLLWSNVESTIARTLRFAFLEIFLACDTSHHKTNKRSAPHTSGQSCISIILRRQTNCYDPLFRLRLYSMSSSAVIIHWASPRIFCKTASDFLEACFVKQSAI